jgi:hypothetical protein
MADAGQSTGARARPADSRSGVHDRSTTAATLQALELVNGERLSNWLLRGARNMLGELPPPPAALFVTPINARGAAAGQTAPRVAAAPFDVGISGATRSVARCTGRELHGRRQGRGGVGGRCADRTLTVWRRR